MSHVFVKFEKAMTYLDIDRRSLLELIKNKKLKAYKTVNGIAFKLAELQDYNQQPTPTLNAVVNGGNATLIGQILVENFIDVGQLEIALQTQAKRSQEGETVLLGEILLEMGTITEEHLAEALHRQLNYEYVDLTTIPQPSIAVLSCVPLVVAESHTVFPIAVDKEKNTVTLATASPQNKSFVDNVSFLIGMGIKLVIATPGQIRAAIRQFYAKDEPKTLAPIRTSSGRLNLNTPTDPKLLAKEVSASVQKWYSEDASLGPRVFIAMPFNHKFDPITDVIVAAVEALNCRALRIDQVPNLRNVWLAIEREIAKADLVIADFSGDVVVEVPNPNVVTEATIALHKYEKPVVVITQSASGLFFDWRHQFAVVYEPNEVGFLRLSRNLISRLVTEINSLKQNQAASFKERNSIPNNPHEKPSEIQEAH